MGLLLPGRVARTAGAMAAHVTLDFIGHDDHTVGPMLQAALGFGALGLVAWGWGPGSPAALGGLTSSAPDLEVALGMLSGRRNGPYIFPSHWQLARTRGTHPYRFRGTRVPIGVEIAVTATAAALLCAAGRRARRTSVRGVDIRP